MRTTRTRFIFLTFLFVFKTEVMGFSNLYGVPNAGWRSPDWHWGYGVGKGHDCAAICRGRYASRQARATLVKQLMDPEASTSSSPKNSGAGARATAREPEDFEEVKLVLALAWQRGRWDGSDGGVGGYGDVLRIMAEAERYEAGDPDKCARFLLGDMKARFHLLDPTDEDIDRMMSLDKDSDVDRSLRKCSGLVLQAMGFVERGL